MAELRKQLRVRTFKGAKIGFRGLAIELDCIVRDLSFGGACLEVRSQKAIPDTFQLILDSGKSVRPCRVAWRKGNRIGIQFQRQLG
jgi:hypothetical protein